jgi:hypothetical protein
MKKLIPILLLLISCEKITFKTQPGEICNLNYYNDKNQYIYFSKKEDLFVINLKSDVTYYDWYYDKKNKKLYGKRDGLKEFDFSYIREERNEIRDGLYYCYYYVEIRIVINGIEYIFKK